MMANADGYADLGVDIDVDAKRDCDEVQAMKNGSKGESLDINLRGENERIQHVGLGPLERSYSMFDTIILTVSITLLLVAIGAGA
jgi:hypothetical protein